MKKLNLFILLIILFIPFVSPLYLYKTNDNIKIDSLYQKCSIEKNTDLYCNVVIDFAIINRTNPYVSFEISDRNLGKQKFYNKSIALCDWRGSMGNLNNEVYFNLSCDTNSKVENYLDNTGNLMINFDSNDLEGGRYYLFFNYSVENFVTEDPLYNTIFFSLYGIQNYTRVYRTIILPKNSVIDIGSLYNFKIMSIREDGRRIVLSDQSGQAILTYRDWNEEQEHRNMRDKIIILTSFAFAIIFGFLFSDKRLSKRTKNCYILLGFFLLITGWILLGGTKESVFLKWILIISLCLFFLCGGLVYYSRKKDYRSSSFKRDITEIKKLILEIFNKIKDKIKNEQ